jgi:hypothetical protein
VHQVDSSLTVRLSTVAGNTAPSGAGFQFAVGTFREVHGSVLANVGGSCSAASSSGTRNVVSDASCPHFSSSLANTNALLGALADNGGPTFTHLPGVGSPVIGLIPAGTAGLCDGTVPTDQRGIARPQSGNCDVGAVEQ